MLTVLPIVVGLSLIFGFFARTMAPAPWNRWLFLGLAVPAGVLTLAGIAVAIYFYSSCTIGTVSRSMSADGRLQFTIDSVDCGDPTARTYQVSLQARDKDGQPLAQNLMRSLGRPAPASVAQAADGTILITLDDGSSKRVVLHGDDLTPDPVYSLVDGKELQ